MSPRKRRLDYALRSRQRGVWLVTAAILLMGVVAILLTTRTGEGGRMRMLERLEPGDSAARVAEVMGEPARRCATGSLDHLRTQFPPGWSPAALEQALERLKEETGQRLIYPVGSRDAADCTPPRGMTEIGMDQEQRVLWYVPVTGKRPLQLPPGLTPQAVDLPDEQNDG
ncbi:MAG TPA: hypothetical protein VGR27_05885 [Longimicrobiaceae bacterium]|nr:hypothetical protein [Longimicrobiaceae bacterium]